MAFGSLTIVIVRAPLVVVACRGRCATATPQQRIKMQIYNFIGDYVYSERSATRKRSTGVSPMIHAQDARATINPDLLMMLRRDVLWV